MSERRDIRIRGPQIPVRPGICANFKQKEVNKYTGALKASPAVRMPAVAGRNSIEKGTLSESGGTVRWTFDKAAGKMNTLQTRFGPIAGVLTSAVIVAMTSGCYTQLAASDRYDDRRDRQADRVVYVEDEDGNIVEEEYYDEDRYYEDDSYYRPRSYRRYFRTYYGDPFYPGYDPYWSSWDYWPSYRYAGWYDPFHYDPFYYDPYYYGSSFYFGISFGWPYYRYRHYRPYYSPYYYYPYNYYGPYYTYYDRPYYGTNKFKGTSRSRLIQPRRTLAGRGSLVDRTRVRRGYDRDGDAVGRSKTRDGTYRTPGVVRTDPSGVAKDSPRSTREGRAVTRSGSRSRNGSATVNEGRTRSRSSGGTEGRTVRRGDRDSKSEYRSGSRGGSEWIYDRRSSDSPRVIRRNSSRRDGESLRQRYGDRTDRSTKSDREVRTLRRRYDGDNAARRSRSYDRRDSDRSSVGGSSYTPRPSREYIRGRSSEGSRSRGTVERPSSRSARSYDAPSRTRRSYDAPSKSRRSYDAPSRRSSSSRSGVSRSGSRSSSPSYRSSGRSGGSSKSSARSSSRSSRSSSRGSRR